MKVAMWVILAVSICLIPVAVWATLHSASPTVVLSLFVGASLGGLIALSLQLVERVARLEAFARHFRASSVEEKQ